MTITKKNPITVICRSCTTWQVVWIYQGPTKNAARLAYYRARRRENTRVRWWAKRMEQRAANIKALLNRLLESLPLMGDISPAQRQAICTLQAIADNPPPCDTAFYNHCMQERRRHKLDQEIRRKKRERELQERVSKDACAK